MLWVFSGWNFKNLLSYLKSGPSDLSKMWILVEGPLFLKVQSRVRVCFIKYVRCNIIKVDLGFIFFVKDHQKENQWQQLELNMSLLCNNSNYFKILKSVFFIGQYLANDLGSICWTSLFLAASWYRTLCLVSI